ncbi:tyrosine-type recombinase/integrase [Nitrosomonas mobilis]|uniref:Putative integrase/recombinase y4qK n=1 Tax=Nitrosomonas mobilis TaxID=51642 RepID=A0A1G5SBA0_9PROT
MFFFTLHSIGLRLGEGLQLQVGDLDAQRMRVLVRDAKGNRDRLVPLLAHTSEVLRELWKEHHNSVLLFPSRQKGPVDAVSAATQIG